MGYTQQAVSQEQSTQNNTGSQSAQQSVAQGNTGQIERTQVIKSLQSWLQEQYAHIQNLPPEQKIPYAHSVLCGLEQAWQKYVQTGGLPALGVSATDSASENNNPLPLELTGSIRPIISVVETDPNAKNVPERAANGTDWNSRLGIPEYRTQSDNLAAPEATCNVTTLSMILERLGINRSDIIAALEKRLKIQEDPTGESEVETDKQWSTAAAKYIDRIMQDSAAYKRIRGAGAVSRSARTELSTNFRDNAQMEDLLDMLLKDMGISRYGVVSEPERLLEAVRGDKPLPSTETLWNTKWDVLSAKVKACLDAGGAAALSFQHKGSRSSQTHIVAIIEVTSDGFKIDDPYGQIREGYNPRRYDDAYWSTNKKGNLIGSRSASSQQNESGEFNDWGVSWARSLSAEESRGKESSITKTQVAQGMQYIQLFYRGTPNTASADK